MYEFKRLLPIFAGAALAFAAEAKVELAPVFTDNAVLQRGMEVPVWGKAAPGEEVTVSFAGQSVSAKAGEDGKWMVKLAPMKESSENRTLEVSGKENKLSVANVLVGEVWLCSGQSNMELPLWGGNPRFRHYDGDKVAAQSNFPLIRIAQMRPYGWSTLPRTDFKITWQPVRPDNIAPFTAAGFFFGRELFQKLNIPIGLISSHWGGTRIEPWTPPEGFNSVPELAGIARDVNAKLPGTADYKKINEATQKAYAEWMEKCKAALAKGEVTPPPPAYPNELKAYTNHQQSTVLYNRMIYPFVPYAMRGAIWYQGESNLGDGALYTQKMQALLNGWKKVFLNPDFKLYFAQLAPFTYGGDKTRLPRIWEAQQKFADNEKDAGMAVINDVGNLKDIHPSDKKTVGERLALLALKRDYGKSDLKADSPTLKSHRVENGKFILDFNDVEQWTTKNNKPAANFEVAAIDGVYYPAAVEIRGTSLVVGSDKVKAPKSLRYMWEQTDEATLANEAGLPLGAFRIEPPVVLDELIAYFKGTSKLVYEYDLLSGSGFGDRTRVNYIADHSKEFQGILTEITYLAVLTGNDGKVKWVAVSMNPFVNDAKKIGVPVKSANAMFQTRIQNMRVLSNVPGIKTGIIGEGNIEFWPGNYGTNNSARIPGANNSTYDFGDQPNQGVGYGSMQIHNYRARQTVFAYNKFDAGKNSDLGIGNAPGRNPDWTFTSSGKNYKEARLYVFVKERPRMSADAVMNLVKANVPAAAAMKPLYCCDLRSGVKGENVTYEFDDSATLSGKVRKVGYYLQLTGNNGKESWVFVSMDAFSPDAKKLGVPVYSSGAVFQTIVKNLEVASNVPGIKTGKFEDGNIEFWPGNYGQLNEKSIPGASNAVFDFGDRRQDPANGYGSMQVHNYREKQTVFAFNQFRGGAKADCGIGNAPGKNLDWTFTGSMANYSKALLCVVVELE